MKALTKSAWRLFKKHIIRLITVAAIVAVSIGVCSGIGEVQNRIKIAQINYYNSQNISDFYIKKGSTESQLIGDNFFNAEEIGFIEKYFGSENTLKSFSYENAVTDDSGAITEITRVYTFDFDNMNINKTELLSGRLPQSPTEVLAERATRELGSYDIGDEITVNYMGQDLKCTVCGTVLNPMLINKIDEPSFKDPNKKLDYVLYFNAVPAMVNDIYATTEYRNEFRAFSAGYKREISGRKHELESGLKSVSETAANITVLTLYENVGMYALNSYGEKVGLISIIFVIFFLLVAMLVVYSNMSRMYDEERGQMACLKTLGYTDFSIIGRYSLFVLIGTVLGGLIALPIGMGLTAILYKTFNMQYAMPPFPGIAHMIYYIITFAVMIISMLALTFGTGKDIVKQKPVTLLTHKAPKSGKKILLERIPFIWNHLSFKHKSAARNILLFKSRFLMTVISVIGSTVLLLAGMGLIDCALKISDATSIIAIAAALIIFSAVLCALVIYNLTNINVSERNREIATLMVLGYHDKEVMGYIFREIYVMCFIGAILGIPCGVGFLSFVFNLVNFGSLADINWWTWILTPAVTMFFSFISTLLLRRKIIGTDMNASLKTRE